MSASSINYSAVLSGIRVCFLHQKPDELEISECPLFAINSSSLSNIAVNISFSRKDQANAHFDWQEGETQWETKEQSKA